MLTDEAAPIPVGRLNSTGWRTYNTRVPGPYWPDTVQTHTTCRALLVLFEALATTSRRINEYGGEAGEKAGMPSSIASANSAKKDE